MNIPEFLDFSAEIELIVSDLYQLIAANTTDPPILKHLEKLSTEELNHANILQTGKTYYKSMPDLFTGLAMDDSEARGALKEAKEIHALFIQKRTPILRQLQTMLEFEKRFEKIHLGASLKIKDETLKNLFVNLTKGDHSHIATLAALIEMLQEKP